jgi:cardiolipin synthase
MGAIDTRERKGRTMIEMEAWVFVLIVGVFVALLVLLWSAQRGRKVRLTIADVDSLAEALPSIAGATHGILLPGNEVEILQNGGLFPALLADIAAARESIHFESYVWWKGEICRQVAQALAAKAKEKVQVRVLLDASGSAKMDPELLALMRDAGCQVRKYRPFRLSNFARINSRDHRKIVVVDGLVGYTFGHGIADEWLGDAQDREHWRDTGVRIEGPVVHQLQSAFTENWVEETGEVIVGDRYFPKPRVAGKVFAHLAYIFNHGSVSAVDLLYRITFAAAHKELLIQNPYLATDPEVIELLAKAAERGADVKLMLPGEVTDVGVVRHAGHHAYDKLLRRGVEIYEYTRTLNHQKVMIVDGLWSHVGSTNLDNRSLESNDEVSLGIADRAIAAELREAFFADLRHCRQIELESWRRRSLWHRVQDWGSYRLNEFL